MLQGWGSWAAAVAVLYATWRAGDALTNFRRQKQEERRIEAAHNILTFAYRFKRTLAGARSALVSGYEIHLAEEKLKENYPNWDMLCDAEKRRLKTAQAAITRLSDQHDVFGRVFEHMPLARALFGEQAEGDLQAHWSAYVSVQVAAEGYAEDTGHDPEFTIKLRRELWGGGDNNEVTQQVDKSVRSLEELLLPIIRH